MTIGHTLTTLATLGISPPMRTPGISAKQRDPALPLREVKRWKSHAEYMKSPGQTADAKAARRVARALRSRALREVAS